MGTSINARDEFLGALEETVLIYYQIVDAVPVLPPDEDMGPILKSLAQTIQRMDRTQIESLLYAAIMKDVFV